MLRVFAYAKSQWKALWTFISPIQELIKAFFAKKLQRDKICAQRPTAFHRKYLAMPNRENAFPGQLLNNSLAAIITSCSIDLIVISIGRIEALAFLHFKTMRGMCNANIFNLPNMVADRSQRRVISLFRWWNWLNKATFVRGEQLICIQYWKRRSPLQKGSRSFDWVERRQHFDGNLIFD